MSTRAVYSCLLYYCWSVCWYFNMLFSAVAFRRIKMEGSLLVRGKGLNWAAVPKVNLSKTQKKESNNKIFQLHWISCSFFLSFLHLDPFIIETLKHKCFLEELLFWTIKFEFPQKMVTFLLNMLPDQDYKVFKKKYIFFCGYIIFFTCHYVSSSLQLFVIENMFCFFFSGRLHLRKRLFNITPSSWKLWWKATSQIQCPTASCTSACSCSATRSWPDTWQRSVICWTSWSWSFTTWWKAALLKVNFRVSCPIKFIF